MREAELFENRWLPLFPQFPPEAGCQAILWSLSSAA